MARSKASLALLPLTIWALLATVHAAGPLDGPPKPDGLPDLPEIPLPDGPPELPDGMNKLLPGGPIPTDFPGVPTSPDFTTIMYRTGAENDQFGTNPPDATFMQLAKSTHPADPYTYAGFDFEVAAPNRDAAGDMMVPPEMYNHPYGSNPQSYGEPQAYGSPQSYVGPQPYDNPQAYMNPEPADIYKAINDSMIESSASETTFMEETSTFEEGDLRDYGLPRPALPKTIPAKARVVFRQNGINSLDHRLANNGMQYSTEPPDQALCVGNGFIIEAVNTVARIRSAVTGAALTPILDFNTWIGLPPQVGPAGYGPKLSDPVCIYDSDTQRFFVTILVIQVNPANSALTGPNSIFVGVSQTSNPTQRWNWYQLPVQNDGTNGTPNHRLPGGPNGAPAPALGDYPQCGHDASGFYITTNEFPATTGGAQVGVNIYAASKRSLAAGLLQVTVSSFFLDNRPLNPGANGDLSYFTVMPARRPPSRKPTAHPKDTSMYFASTLSGGVPQALPLHNDILFWSLQGTRTLNDVAPNLRLVVTRHRIGPYIEANVARPTQNVNGVNPLGQQAVFFGLAGEPLGVQPLGASDSRMGWLAETDKKLWAVFNTAGVGPNNQLIATRCDIIAVEINPELRIAKRVGVLSNGNYLLQPALAMTPEGEGVVTFTHTGNNLFPSAGYAVVEKKGFGRVTNFLVGQGVQDGATQYQDFGTVFYRPRWGDYSAAAVDEQGFCYIATEYIPAPNCGVNVFGGPNGPIGRCGNTRTAATNWGTGIAKLSLKPIAY